MGEGVWSLGLLICLVWSLGLPICLVWSLVLYIDLVWSLGLLKGLIWSLGLLIYRFGLSVGFLTGFHLLIYFNIHNTYYVLYEFRGIHL